MKFKLSLPLQLLLIIACALLFGSHLPIMAKQIAFAISITIKDILLFVLPVIIFSYLTTCLYHLRAQALLFLAILLPAVCISIAFGALSSYGIASLNANTLNQIAQIACNPDLELKAFWHLAIPKWISNDTALFIGLIVGLILSFKPIQIVAQATEKLKELSNFFLNRLFIPIFPLFILGFMLKLQHDGQLVQIIQAYGPIFLIVILFMACYLCFLYFVAANFNFSRFKKFVVNMFPAMIGAFSTMSSAAAMPLTIRGTENNTGKPEMAQALIPATVNIHMIGDCIAIPFFALAVMISYNYAFPSLWTYLPFVFYFVVTRFAVAAVPGGGVFVTLPLLVEIFGFNEPMTALITTLYIMLDPFITTGNALGNGALAVMITKLFGKAKRA